MYCSDCRTPLESADEFCPECGGVAEFVHVPAIRPEQRPSQVWREVRPAVIRGLALVAAGALLRVVAGQAFRIAVRSMTDGDELPRPFRFANGRSLRRGPEEIEIFFYRRIRH
jgi:hypothetical protein